MASDRAPAGKTQRGFVLAVTLWLLAGIAVVAALVMLWAMDRVADVQVDRDAVEDQLAMMSTRDTVVYLAATRDLTVAGLPMEPIDRADAAMRMLDDFGTLRRDPIGGELSLDDRAYAGIGGTGFSLQDEAGLVSLAWPGANGLDRLLKAWDVDDQVAPRLRDALLDYIDHDDLRHLNGAESREYERAGRPAPPNRRLLVPREIDRVLGWDALPPARREAIARVATTFYAGAVNLNFAPADVLALYLPSCRKDCAALIERRQRQPFRNSDELEAVAGEPLPGDPLADYRFAPSDTLRLTLWGRSGAAWRIHVRLTPLADQRAPWSFLAAYPVARPSLNEPPRPIDSALFADATTGRR